MLITRIHHFTIRTPMLEKTAYFYEQVIGLIIGQRPSFSFSGVWLYAEGEPILHLVYQPISSSVSDDKLEEYLGKQGTALGSGAIDHISLKGTNLQKMQSHLSSFKELNFRERIVPELHEHQIFLEDPNGITIEVIFPYSLENTVISG